MAFHITFNITADPDSTVARIMDEARKVGVAFNGDDKQGTFSGFNAKGSYSREGNQIPPFLSPELLT